MCESIHISKSGNTQTNKRLEPKLYVYWYRWTMNQKLHLKLRQQSAICWNSLALFRENGLNYIFFRNKTFLFFKIESWNFQQLFEIEFRETSHNFNSFSSFRQFLFQFFSIFCLIALKFCEVSRNSLSNRCWKFQLCILKNKKVLFLKKII